MRRQGPPKHLNRYAWKPNAGLKINETEPGGGLGRCRILQGYVGVVKNRFNGNASTGNTKLLLSLPNVNGVQRGQFGMLTIICVLVVLGIGMFVPSFAVEWIKLLEVILQK
ncbi:hypothetical protein Nepgr_006198 [Nepenthes gracilis]|uniref:Uncharacterized protein n=1 Tax=Nepenthes gracilis TaxID=150966 RepID=A0AAD3S4Z1_NEPGR|nr:hypothetical protein Nepgr_006198 [Nepenthes gracilis]